ncbi:hypothetical protein, partial [Roseburia intestinalis]|uniref:hypothetical protein n=1 Tax=Roseburia intestinalis TaxID=166486 RepID=UPI001FB929A4
MRKELGLDSKSGYKDSGVGNGKDPWRSYESGTTALQTGGRQIDYNAYIKRLETIDMEYENIRID